jgi:hypothetical protein
MDEVAETLEEYQAPIDNQADVMLPTVKWELN